MGLLERFIDGMHIGGDDYDDEFDDDYEDDDYEDTPPRKGPFKKKKKDFDYDLEDDIVSDNDKIKSVKTQSKIRPMKAKRSGSDMEVCVFKPTRFEESKEITDTLLNRSTVVLNMEGLDVEIAQRIIDFISGSCYAIDGNLQKISNYIFIVTPKGVDISGDIQDILAGAFDVPNI